MFYPSAVLRAIQAALSHAAALSWPFAVALTVGHALSVALGFALLGERDLVSSAVQFVYFYVVTGSSVGYGDFSPVTPGGKLFAALWVIPGAISIFAFVIGKIIAAVSMRMRRTMNGLGDFHGKTGHLVVLGHVPGQTERLLEETRRLHGARDVVIVATQDLSARRDGWDWVRATALSHSDDLRRAGIAGADLIVVLTPGDEEALTACLALAALEPKGHCVAYFREAPAADLIETHCPMIETVTATEVEQLARALSDPGASDLLRRLVSTRVGSTLHSARLATSGAVAVGELMPTLLERFGATLIGFRPVEGGDPVMALSPGTLLRPGQVIYYIATERLAEDLALDLAGRSEA